MKNIYLKHPLFLKVFIPIILFTGSSLRLSAVTPTPTVTDVNSCGSSKLATTATGSLLWNTGATTSSITVTASGTYSVTATVSGSTSAAGTGAAAPLSVPAAPVVTDSDNCNGTSLLTASGYVDSVMWSAGGSRTSSILVSSAGTYSVVQTVGGCVSPAGTAIASPRSTPARPTVTDTNSCGSSLLYTTSTGALLWSNSATTSSITVTNATVYGVTTTVNGCTSPIGAASSAPLTIPSVPTVTVTNYCGYTVLYTPSSGSLSWNTGATTASLTVTVSATYSVTATVSGCTGAAGTATSAPKAIPAAPDSVNDVDNCNSTSTLTVSGYTGTLQWEPGGSSASSILVSTAGTYSVTQTVSGCASPANTIVASPRNTPARPVVTVTGNCNSTSTLSTVSTGALLWSDSATTSSITVSGTAVYDVTATVNGCTSPAGAGTAAPTTTPSTPAVTAVNNCDSSKLSTTATGSLLWNTGATTTSITITASGTYSVTRAVSGCVSSAGTNTASPLTVPSSPVVTAANYCSAPSVLSTTSTGTLLWSNSATTTSITVTTAGTYTLTQTATNGCTSAAGSGTAVLNTTPASPVVTDADDCGSSVLSTAASGALLWNTGATTTSITVTAAASYSLTQTINGCTSSAGTGAASPLSIPLAPTVSDVDNCGNSILSTTTSGILLWSTGATTTAITVTTAATYSVTTTAGDGCTSVAGIGTASPLTVPSTPAVSEADSCGSSVLSTAASGTLLWSTGATTSGITVTTSGTYSVTTTIGDGCSNTAGITASVTIPTIYYADVDGDHYLDSSNQVSSCTGAPTGYYPIYTLPHDSTIGYETTPRLAGDHLWDCNDSCTLCIPQTGHFGYEGPSYIHPGAQELCNGIDDNCNGYIDDVIHDGLTYSTFYVDMDGDGFGNAAVDTVSCLSSEPYSYMTFQDANGDDWSLDSTDCNDDPTAAGGYIHKPPVVTITGGVALCSGTATTLHPYSQTTPAYYPFEINDSLIYNRFSADSAAANGNTPYQWITYSWAGGATTEDITVSAAGTYSVTVTQFGCVGTAGVTMLASTPSVSANVITNLSCYGDSSGSITAHVTGGHAPFTYLWSPGGGTDSTVTGLFAGADTVTVTDSVGCTAIANNAISNPTVLIPAGDTSFCQGSSITLDAGSGYSSYLWSTGATTQTISVSSSNGIADQLQLSINGNVKPMNWLNVSINGSGYFILQDFDGNLVFTKNGQFSTDANGQIIHAPTGYLVQAFPAESDGSIIHSLQLIELNDLVAPDAGTGFDPLGNVLSGFSGIFSPTSGSPPYTTNSIIINPDGTIVGYNDHLPGLSEINGQIALATFTDSSALTSLGNGLYVPASTSDTTYIDVPGGSNGSGTIAYAYPAGFDYAGDCYFVARTAGDEQVYEHNGQFSIDSSGDVISTSTGNVIQWMESPDIYISDFAIPSGVDSITIAADGTVKFLISGSYQLAGNLSLARFSNSLGLSPLGVDLYGESYFSGVATIGMPPYGTSINHTHNLSVSVTNETGCLKKGYAAVTELSKPPAPVLMAFGSTALCSGSSIEIDALNSFYGGYPFSKYLWNNGDTTMQITVSAAASYYATVTNSAGCTSSFSDTITTTISTAHAGAGQAICTGDSVTLGATPAARGGTSPYIYKWSPSAGLSDSTLANPKASPGSTVSYILTATDSSGCVAHDTVSVTINPQPSAAITSSTDVSCNGGSNGTATASASGGTAPYAYLWAPSGGTGSTASGLSEGDYAAIITDANGCSASDITSINLSLHNTSSTAIAFEPYNIYTDYSTGDTSVWFKFTAYSNPLSIKITKPINSIDGADAVFQSAKLYSGSSDSLTFVDGWYPSGADSGLTEININYSGLTIDSSYYLLLSRTDFGCADFALEPSVVPSPSDCGGSFCDLVGDGTFSGYMGCSNDSIPFALRCVPCWSCSHGTPQIGGSPGNYYALMWAQNDGQGEGIENTLDTTLFISRTNLMYVFEMKYRLDSLSPPGSSFDIHARLTTYAKATTTSSQFGCGMSMPPVPNGDTLTIIRVPNVSNSTWVDTTVCMSSSDMTIPALWVLWIYPTTIDSIAWMDVGDIHIYVIDADLGDSEICICRPSTLKPVNCPPPGNLDISYQWKKNDTLMTGETADSIIVSPLASGATPDIYSLTMMYGSCSASSQIKIKPPCTPPLSITPAPAQICSNNDSIVFSTDTSGAGYKWLWSTGATTSSIVVRAVLDSNETVIVTDTNNYGCGATDSLRFHWLPYPTIHASTSGSCNGSNQIQDTVTITGDGSMNVYKYAWSPSGDTTSTVTLAPGSYIVQVTDSNQCVAIDSVTVGFSITDKPVYKSPTCIANGKLIAKIKIDTASRSSFTYTWSLGLDTVSSVTTTAKSDTVSGLDSGTYFIKVEDLATMCFVTDSIDVINNFYLESFVYTNTLCDNSGTALAILNTALDNSHTYSYTFTWIYPDDTIYTATNTVGKDSISGLAAGTYTVTVTDGNCFTKNFVTILQVDTNQFTIVDGGLNVCGGEAWVHAKTNERGPYHYQWSTGRDTISSLTSDTVSGFVGHISSDTLIVTVTNTITHCMATDTFTVPLDTLPTVLISGDTAVCMGRADTLRASGASTYRWSTGATTSAITVTAAGSYTVTGTSSHGCIGTDTVTIKVDSLPIATISVTGDTIFCAGDSVKLISSAGTSYSWSSGATTSAITVSSTGSYSVTVTNSSGCSATSARKMVTVNEPTASGKTVASCNSYRWGEATYTASATVTDTTTNAAGCDSIITLHLTINYSDTSKTTVTACNSFVWNDSTYTTDGIYSVLFASGNAAGCDSTAILYLTINYSDTSKTTVTACNSYIWNDRTYTTGGTYSVLFAGGNAAGCDSTAILYLTIHYSDTSKTTVTACNSYVWNDSTYTAGGTYSKFFAGGNAVGCDSTAYLVLTINRSDTSYTSVTACNSYIWNDVTYTAGGAYSKFFTGGNALGCDSTAILYLTINYSSNSSVADTACNSYIWNGVTYTSGGTYTHSDSSSGCTSTDTLHLTINYSNTGDTTVTACNSFTWYETTYTASTNLPMHTISDGNIDHCDSAVTLHLTIHYSDTSKTTVTACNSYIWNDRTYTTGGTYSALFASGNAAGCDSTAILYLTIHYSDTSKTTVAACNSYIWNDETYTTGGIYSAFFPAGNGVGCDSTAYLNLTINYSDTSQTTATACNSYIWDDETYTTGGTYSAFFPAGNGAGCDSTAYLNLTINYSDTSKTTVTSCNSYTWNDQIYTVSGTYSDFFPAGNAVGCDSTAYLALVINYSDTSYTPVTACNSYTWNDQTYTVSGTYSDFFAAGNTVGCDSTAYLVLTINYSSNSSVADTACNSYIWNGVTYTSSGTYTYSDSSSGCTSTDTLHLIINYDSTSSVTDTACNSFSWNGTTYTASGVYTHSYSNSSGCASTDTLHLVINSLTVTPANDTLKCSYDSLVITANGAATYLWSTGATTASIVVKLADTSIVRTHIYTVTGTNGSCSATDTATVTWPPRLNMSAKQYNVSCGTYCDTITLTGGNLPYTYISFDSVNYAYTGVNTFCGLWLSQSPSFIGIDTNGCVAVSSGAVVIGGSPPPNPLSAICTVVHNASCSSCTDGKDSVIVSGGYPPYSYRWLPDSSTNSIDSGLTAGSYSVIVTDSMGCAAACSDTIYNVNGCSGSGYTAITDSAGFLPGGTYSGNVTLNASVVIDTDVTVVFSGLNLLAYNNVSITVDSGATLTITCGPDSSYLHACDSMWYGIIVLPGGTLIANCNTRMEDAEYAVEAHHHSNITTKQTTFNNDYVGIYVPPNSAGNTLNTGFIYNCTFTCSSPLKDGYPGDQDPGLSPLEPSPHPLAGIYVNDLTLLMLWAPNEFDNLNYGVFASNSNVYVYQNVFENILDYNSYVSYPSGIGIFAMGTGGANSLTYWEVESDSGPPVTFNHCICGIKTQYMNVNVTGANMTNMRSGIDVENSTNQSIYLRENTISASVEGIGLIMDNNNNMTVLDNTDTLTSLFGAGTGINIESCMGNPTTYDTIQGNHIYMGNASQQYGMHFTASSFINAGGNVIKLNSTPLQAYGIENDGATDTVKLENNDITGNFASLVSSGSYAISSKLCYNFLYSCNCTNNTWFGFYFDGAGLGTLQTSNIYDHNTGLYIDSAANIGEQYHQGNLWLGNYGSTYGAFWNTSSAIAPFSQIIYNLENTAHFTTNNFPLGTWFKEDDLNSDDNCTNNSCK